MRKKRIAKGLSLILAAALCLGGSYTVPEVYAASGSVADPMTEIAQEEKEIAAELCQEDEKEYLEEPEDYSWMEKLLEEQEEEQSKAQSAIQLEEQPDGDVFLQSGTEDSFELAEKDTDLFQVPEEGVFGSEDYGQVVNSPDVFSDATNASGISGGAFSDGTDPVFDDPKQDFPTEEHPEESLFTSGESGELFSAGEEPDSGIGETEAVLQLEEGEDFITELNILLYKVKDLATDEHPYKVIIPPGNYEIKGTISMYSNIHLYAVGAVMKKTSAKKQILLRLGNSEVSEGGYNGYRNITIEGGTWDCNYESCANKEAPGGFVGFRIGHATNVTIKDATFLNNLKSHFLEFGGVKKARVTGCTFEGYWTPHETTGQECIQIDICLDEIFPRYQPFDGTVCTDIVIEKNRFQNVFAGAGSHSMMFNEPYTKIVIRDNVFTNVKKRAVWLLNCKDSTVSNNTMKNVGGGIYVTSMRGTHAHVPKGLNATSKQNQQAQNVVVSNNKITLAKSCYIAGVFWRSYGIQLAGEKVTNSPYGAPAGDYILRGVTIKGNVIKGPGNGIRLIRCSSCRISGNTVSLTAPKDFTNFGIYMGGSRNNQITSNKVSNAANTGIYLYTSSSYDYGSTGNKITGNQVKNCAADGIRIGGKSNNSILEKNTLSGNGACGIVTVSSTITSIASNKAVSNGKEGIYCYNSTVKSQKKNTLQGNKSNYAIRFYKSQGKVQTVKNITVNSVKKSSKKVTGVTSGGKTASVYLQKNGKKLGSAKLTKAWKYSVPIKAQKKGTVLSIKVADKYGNVVIKQVKVV